MVEGYRMVGESKKVVEISVHLNLPEYIVLRFLRSVSEIASIYSYLAMIIWFNDSQINV